jgi:hypothetical protein
LGIARASGDGEYRYELVKEIGAGDETGVDPLELVVPK